MPDNEALIEQARSVSMLEVILSHGIKLRRSGHEHVGPCPKCGGTDRFSINSEKGVFNCRGCRAAGDVIDLVEFIDGLSFAEAIERLAGQALKIKHGSNGKPNGAHAESRGPGPGVEVAHYDYTDETGNLLYQVVRYEPKTFRQRKPNGGGWDWSVAGARAVPYRLPELMEALALDRRVFIVEGEKDADNLWRLGMPATTNAGGAGKWPMALDPYFAGADVIIVGDNDPQSTDKTGKPLFHPDGRPKRTGQDHAHGIAARLIENAASIRVLEIGKVWLECPPKGDISDWLFAGGTPEALNDVIERLPAWTPEQAKQVPLVPLIYPSPIDETTIPRRQWIIPGLLLRRHLSVLVAPPGIGKSLLTLQIGMAIAAGISWGGWRPRRRAKVLFINSEDDRDEMRRRLTAARRIMDIEWLDLRGIAFAEEPTSIVVARADSRTKTVTRTPMADAIIATIIAGQFDVVIVDPFAETFEGDENSNSELKWAAALWREIARRTNTAIALVHHTRKFGAEAGNIDSARGATALIGVARIVSTLFPMTEAEADKMLEDSTKRGSYLRFDDAKANLTLVTLAARWFEKQTITLDNAGDGPDGPEPADEVGVLVPWAPPNVWDKLDAMTANRILDAIARGKLNDQGEPTGDPFALKASGRNNDRWAGRVVQSFVACDDKQAKKILDTWIKNGVLEEFEAAISTSNRQLRKCLRVVEGRRPGTTTVNLTEMNLVADDEPNSD